MSEKRPKSKQRRFLVMRKEDFQADHFWESCFQRGICILTSLGRLSLPFTCPASAPCPSPPLSPPPPTGLFPTWITLRKVLQTLLFQNGVSDPPLLSSTCMEGFSAGYRTHLNMGLIAARHTEKQKFLGLPPADLLCEGGVLLMC